MILCEAPVHQRVKASSGVECVVLAHGQIGVLVLAFHQVRRNHQGKVITVRERRVETWSNSTVCAPLGQLVLDL